MNLLLFEILFEIRVDAWKICNIYKRADPHRSEDIGVFKDIILIMAYIGAINNSGLIIFTSGLVEGFFVSDPDKSKFFITLVDFVVLEHVLLIGMFLISALVPDYPEIVEKGLIWGERMIKEKIYYAKNDAKLTSEKSTDKNHADKKAAAVDFQLKETDLEIMET